MAVLCMLLSAVCLTDYRSGRIPNILTLAVFLYGLGYRYWDAGGRGAGSFLGGSFLVLLILYPLFKIGTVGAGDVKLCAATAGYLSGQTVVWFLLFSLLTAAGISLIKILREQCGRERFGYFCAYLAEVCRTGRWRLYFDDRKAMRKAGVCLSGPVLFSLLLHLGGVY